MDDLKIMMFEDPSALYWIFAAWAVVAAVVLYFRRTRGVLIATALPVVLAVATGVLAWAVTTERERLQAALDDLAAAVAAADEAGIDAWIDPAYADGLFVKATLAPRAARAVKAAGVRTVRLFEVKLAVDGEAATTALRAMVHLRETGYGRDVIPTRWRLEWVRREAGWRLIRTELVEPSLPGAPRGR